MKVVLSPQAARDLENQFQYLIDHGAGTAARALKARVLTFLRETLTSFPRFGVLVDYRGLREAWIPKTKLVVWYRLEVDRIEIVRFWHASQDRHSFE